jgi:biopolymer transport protein TolR
VLRRSHRYMDQINVVPYIDVMLVLLVIFMITAPLMNPGQIDLPQVGQALKPPVGPMEITIKADHTLLLRDPAAAAGKEVIVSSAEVAEAVKRKQEKNPEQAVVIAGDKNVRYEAVLNVMDILQQAQVKKIGLLARSRSE